ncbi:hypothetical protein [Bifidobacterium miconisargentati]|uniref:hypothetical protein n=1 Tax=Bifidobacterium miconisargentati TaxID=2834437 RepID=UPI001BDD717C|nr:hypothetical protein [Bifidobacterium miconisargentati]MBW3090081.1 hypothetical protein [Bifidobacterium miconisargentati]
MNRDEMIYEGVPAYAVQPDDTSNAAALASVIPCGEPVPHRRDSWTVMIIGLGLLAHAMLWALVTWMLVMVLEGITYDPSGYAVLAGMMITSALAIRSAEAGALALVLAAIIRIVEWFKERKIRREEERYGQSLDAHCN